MTNELNLFSPAAIKKGLIATSERKKMSTKTLRKRIALVAVAALGFTGLTIVSANAAVTVAVGTTPWNVSTAYAGTGTTAATQVVGGNVQLTFAETVTVTGSAAAITSFSSTGVGVFSSASVSGGTTIYPTGVGAIGVSATAYAFPNVAFGIGSTSTSAVALVTTTINVTSSVAGTQTLTATIPDSNGTPSATYTATITWLPAASTGVNAANSSIWVQSSATCAAASSTSKATDLVAYTSSVVPIYPAGGTPTVCVIARDANNNLVSLSSSSTISSSINGGGAVSGTVTSGRVYKTLTAVSGAQGNATISAVLIDSYSNVVTLSTSVAFYGTLSSLALGNVTYAAYAASDNTTLTNTYAGFADQASTSKVGVLSMLAKDSGGNVIDVYTSGSTNSITTSNWTIDSDKTPGAPADRASDSLGATITAVSPEATDLSSAYWGANVAYVTCSAYPEKLTLTAWGKDSAGNWVKSNPATFYCSGAASKVNVTADMTSAQVNITDANGYPVPDLTSVTLAASNGAVVAPSSKSTENGKFHTAAVVLPSATNAFTVTAIVGSKSGTSASVGTNASSTTDAQIASLIAKINALSKLIAKIQKKLGVK